MSQDTVLVILAIVWGVGSTALSYLVVRMMVRSNWNGPLAAFPAREPSAHDAPADTRRFQSFKAGFVNLGWSVHVTADRRYLHLRPALVGRWIGLAGASLPWDAIELTGGGLTPTMGKATQIKLGFHTLAAPAWIARHHADVVAAERGTGD